MHRYNATLQTNHDSTVLNEAVEYGNKTIKHIWER